MRRSVIAFVALCCLLAAGTARASEQSQLLSSRGLVEFHADRIAKALELFEQAVAADPQDMYARYYHATARGRLGDFDSAIADLRAVLAAMPYLDQAALDLGVALIQTHKYREALPLLRQAQRTSDLDGEASLFLGLGQLRLDRIREGRRNFQRAAAKGENQRLTATYYEGVADYQEGYWASAEAHFAEVIKESPDSAIGREAAAFLTKIRRGQQQRYQVYGALGFQYDSNVVLAPSDEAIKSSNDISKQADGRGTISAGGLYIPWRSDHLQLSLGYDFYQSLHFKLSDFNLEDHGPSMQLSGHTGPIQYGVIGRYDYYLLESDSFLQEGTVLPWIAILDGRVGRTEVSYRMRRRDFKKLSFDVRDSFNHAAAVRETIYLGAPERSVSIGYQFDREDPVPSARLEHEGVFTESDARSFAYDGHELDAGVGWAFPYAVTADATYAFRYELYAAESENPLDNLQPRKDKEHQFVIALRKQLNEWFDVTAAFLGDFNNSNDPRFKYDRQIVSLTLGVRY
ncbi:MAG TPA: tetratricopeptide repeat protein [Candidatus Acidoferrales bacterium]|nr:tetratricopeptide repeat protein [Candidatus Acidoferrales bacterium]